MSDISNRERSAKAAAWDECLAAVTAGIESAKNTHAQRGHRQIAAALAGLMLAVPDMPNPYRADLNESAPGA